MKVWRIGTIATQVMGMILFSCLTAMGAEMDWNMEKKFNLTEPALDMALSPDGKYMYILDESGNLNVYNMNGKLDGTIPVGKGFNKILPHSQPDTLLLSNQNEKSVEVLTLDFIYEIDIKGSPFRGPENAPVTLSLFTDFQCPYCAQMGTIIESVFKEFPNEVKLVYKSFPLRNHQYAVDAAKAAMAAHKMGKFWEFHDLLFENYNQLNKEKIDHIREELKLEKKEFDQHVNDPKTMQMIRNDYKIGIDVGVRGTPALYLNGKQFKNRNPKALIESIKMTLKENSSK